VSRLLKRTIFWCVLFALLWLSGLFWFAAGIPAGAETTRQQADAIVILTGGKNRLDYGMRLLAEGRAPRLFISGVHETITEKQLINLVPPELQNHINTMDEDAVVIGREAWNTIGNAEETKRWLESKNVHSILLVTSNYHMPRSYYEFRHLVKGIDIIPAPVPAEDFSPTRWWLMSNYRMLVLSEYHKYIASKIRNALVRTL